MSKEQVSDLRDLLLTLRLRFCALWLCRSVYAKHVKQRN